MKNILLKLDYIFSCGINTKIIKSHY